MLPRLVDHLVPVHVLPAWLYCGCGGYRQLLLDCNIGDRPGGSEDAEGVACLSAVSQHRALIFCQYKSMLDIIEQDLLK